MFLFTGLDEEPRVGVNLAVAESQVQAPAAIDVAAECDYIRPGCFEAVAGGQHVAPGHASELGESCSTPTKGEHHGQGEGRLEEIIDRGQEL